MLFLKKKFLQLPILGYFTIPRMSMSMGVKTYLVQRLPKRALIKVSGKEVETYLQGLITNDIKHLLTANSMYAMILNNKGRVLFDIILYKAKEPDTIYIECDSSAVIDVKKHLSIYKVRREINIEELEEKWGVWAGCSSDVVNHNFSTECKPDFPNYDVPDVDNIIRCGDPRISHLGNRFICPVEYDVARELRRKNLNAIESNFYTRLRYQLGVGEGVKELPPGNCFPLEANCDYMHGVSFHKGCYIGQELTARTYHTGAIRKRLMPMFFSSEMEDGLSEVPVLPAEGNQTKSLGKLRGVNGNVGIGLLRISEVLTAKNLKVNDMNTTAGIPFWWPSKAPKLKQNIQ